MSAAPLATAVTPLAEARGLEVTFRRRGRTVRALDGVDLEWRQNEVLGVVGESGCGKTTLARTLLGLEQPTGGELRFEGATLDRGGVRTLRRKVQMVFQDPYQSLNPRMRVSDLVQEPLRMQGMAPGRARAARRDRARGRRPRARGALLAPLSARALRRSAAARRDRQRARAGAGRARVRRARLGARRLRARAGAAPAARPAPGARAGAAPDHARHRPRLGALRPRRGHVPRARDRDRQRRRRARAPTAPVHAGADRRRAEHPPAAGRPGGDPRGRGARRLAPPERLPLPPALPARARALRRRGRRRGRCAAERRPPAAGRTDGAAC